MDSSRLYSVVRQLLGVSKETWARVTVGGTCASLPIPSVTLLSASTLACDHLLELSPAREFGSVRVIEEIARYGVRIVEESPGPLDEHFVHFAVFDPGLKEVHVSRTSVADLTDLIDKAHLTSLLGSFSVSDVVLWHEYFHVWSDVARISRNHSKGILQRLMGHGNQTTEERTIEELAAVEFSRLACQLNFHPQLLQWLLVYTKDSERAFELAKNILEKS